MILIQDAKLIVRQLVEARSQSDESNQVTAVSPFIANDYKWRGVHPFYEQDSYANEVDVFWSPLKKSFKNIQQREDIFFSGENDVDDGQSVWVCSMGHFMGLFDEDWLNIPATQKIAFLRYAEFFRVVDNKVAETALFVDILSIMEQADCYPLPPQTGASFVYPGPRNHKGINLEPNPVEEGRKTLDLVNLMISDLSSLNDLDDFKCPPELLSRTWHDDMAWYGPTGIGASYTIERYQEQHQYPFRLNLTDKRYNGHVARIAEGDYCGFFGWPNLNNRNSGGFLGLPRSSELAEMRVVDIYRRENDKLAENWVFIDLLHYLHGQGLDVLKRLQELRRIKP